MPSSLLVVVLVVSVALTLLFLAMALRARSKAAEQAGEEGGRGGRGQKGRWRALGGMLRPDRGQAADELKSRAVQAGLYGEDAIDLFLTIRLLLLVVGAGGVLVVLTAFDGTMTKILCGSLILLATLLGPSMWLDRRRDERQQEIIQTLPDMLDLLVVCLGAGLSLPQALERVSASGENLLSVEVRMIVSDMQLGMATDQAFKRFAARIGGDHTAMLASLIGKASTLGARIGELLQQHAATMREQQLMQLEEVAGKANAKLSLPLTMCLLPSSLLVLAGPAIVGIMNAF